MFICKSPLDKLISAFDDFKSSSKKYLQSRYKAFESLEIWSRRNNNIAIEDVAVRLEQLFSRLNDEFTTDKLNSISSVSNMFTRFKQFDSNLIKFQKYKHSLVLREQKYLKKIRECPAHKNIRDYEVKYEKTKRQRELADLKLFELSTEIDSTKSILFKKSMLSLNETLQRQNEAERVLLVAMKELLGQIPDVSGEEVDDLGAIIYENKAACAEICMEAKKRLITLSVSRLAAEAVGRELVTTNEEDESTPNLTSFRSLASPLKPPRVCRQSSTSIAPSAPPQTVTSVHVERRSVASLYPRLDLIAEDESVIETTEVKTSPPTPPPPTYSDSESQYGTMRNCDSSFTHVSSS